VRGRAKCELFNTVPMNNLPRASEITILSSFLRIGDSGRSGRRGHLNGSASDTPDSGGTIFKARSRLSAFRPIFFLQLRAWEAWGGEGARVLIVQYPSGRGGLRRWVRQINTPLTRFPPSPP